MQTLKAPEVKDDQSIVKQSTSLVEQAQAFEIKDDLSCQRASEILATLKTFIEGPGTYHDQEIEAAHSLHKLLCGKRNLIVDGPKAAYKVLKDRLAGWLYTQEQKRQEAQRKAEDEARRKEAEKQKAIQDKIDEENRKIKAQQEEEARIQAEKDAEAKKIKDKEERKKFEEEESARREKQKAIDEENARKAAEKTMALEEKKEAVYVAPKVVASISTPQGVSLQFEWEPVIENKTLVPDMYKIVDLAGLKKDQKSRKGELIVPGVRFVKKAIGSMRGAS